MPSNRFKRREALRAASSSPAAADSGMDSGSDMGQSPQPIMDNPQAMKCVQDLQSMGYTADDVEQAMGGGDQDAMQSGSAATAAAPMQLPGMQ